MTVNIRDMYIFVEDGIWLNDHLLRSRMTSAYVPATVFSTWFVTSSRINWSVSTSPPIRGELITYDPSGVLTSQWVTGMVKVPCGTYDIGRRFFNYSL